MNYTINAAQAACFFKRRQKIKCPERRFAQNSVDRKIASWNFSRCFWKFYLRTSAVNISNEWAENSCEK